MSDNYEITVALQSIAEDLRWFRARQQQTDELEALRAERAREVTRRMFQTPPEPLIPTRKARRWGR
jgi:hypothetical protein